MRLGNTLKLLAIALITLLVLVLAVLLLLATDKLLEVWERVSNLGPWAPAAYASLLILVSGLFAWLLWRILFGSSKSVEPAPAVVDRESLERRMDHDLGKGVPVQDAREELDELSRRQQESEIYLALFGAASAGKSSLIQALLPGTDLETDVVGGTTRSIQQFDGASADHTPLRIVDLPGFAHEATADLADAAREEALRAHVVLYLCDGDLDRTQTNELKRLLEFDKPIVVVLNKADRFSSEDQNRIMNRIGGLSVDHPLSTVAVTAGGSETVIRVADDGSEQQVVRERPPDIATLWRQILKSVRDDSLAARQQHSVLKLASEKLARAETEHRARAAQELTQRYSRRAVIGALAALTPGSDLVIQAALATRFLKEMGELFDTPVRQIDIDRFLDLASGRLKKTTALVLAIAGNAMKAFPGAGTLAGGLVHAVAYGLIFDSLGRTVAAALTEKQELNPVWAAERFEEEMNEDLQARAGDIARLAMAELRRRDS
ncbi:MAG: 50S ribosome-binding GTPase [Xanthomonadales bacterium]|nr:50S ribosome-binding GTPase [Xanthomonadales bacterium]